jgi:hypothetical protein
LEGNNIIIYHHHPTVENRYPSRCRVNIVKI